MVTAHDPDCPIITISDLSPCPDGTGVICPIGARSKWAGEEGHRLGFFLILGENGKWSRERC